MVEVVYTQSYAPFDSRMVGQSQMLEKPFADELIRKGYATIKIKKDTPIIDIKPIRISNAMCKKVVKRPVNKNKVTAYMATFPSRENVLAKAILSSYPFSYCH